MLINWTVIFTNIIVHDANAKKKAASDRTHSILMSTAEFISLPILSPPMLTLVSVYAFFCDIWTWWWFFAWNSWYVIFSFHSAVECTFSHLIDRKLLNFMKNVSLQIHTAHNAAKIISSVLIPKVLAWISQKPYCKSKQMKSLFRKTLFLQLTLLIDSHLDPAQLSSALKTLSNHRRRRQWRRKWRKKLQSIIVSDGYGCECLYILQHFQALAVLRKREGRMKGRNKRTTTNEKESSAETSHWMLNYEPIILD